MVSLRGICGKTAGQPLESAEQSGCLWPPQRTGGQPVCPGKWNHTASSAWWSSLTIALSRAALKETQATPPTAAGSWHLTAYQSQQKMPLPLILCLQLPQPHWDWSVSKYPCLKILNQNPAIISFAAARSLVFALAPGRRNIFCLVPQSSALQTKESPFFRCFLLMLLSHYTAQPGIAQESGF